MTLACADHESVTMFLGMIPQIVTCSLLAPFLDLGWSHVGRDSSVVSEDLGCKAWRDPSPKIYEVVALRTTLSPSPRTYDDLALRDAGSHPTTPRLGVSDKGREQMALYVYVNRNGFEWFGSCTEPV